jgi:hypothetical protein
MNPWDGGKGTPDKGVKSHREAYCDNDGRVKTGVKLREGGLEDAKTVRVTYSSHSCGARPAKNQLPTEPLPNGEWKFLNGPTHKRPAFSLRTEDC